MSAHCCDHDHPPAGPDPRYRKALWIALVVNAAMFFVEVLSGVDAQSVSLLADAVDFFGDATNYGVSLYVLALAPVWRSRTALTKGITMGLYGSVVLALTARNLWLGITPAAATMGIVGAFALAANVGVAIVLYRFRNGDADMRSVWLCTRNDALGNLAILLAAAGVFGTGRGWPDHLVAIIMGLLALTASVSVIRHALAELRSTAQAQPL